MREARAREDARTSNVQDMLREVTLRSGFINKARASLCCRVLRLK